MNGRALKIAGLALLLAQARPACAETLFDAIRLAYEANPALRAQRAQLRATDEGLVQARASLGPQISVNAQGGRQWATVNEASVFGGPSTTDYHATNGQADISLTQPIYSSGAGHAQIQGAKAGILAGREDLRQAESQVLQQVITAYLDVRRDRATIKVLQDAVEHLTRDFEEIKAKGAAGALTKTDVAESQARLLAALAQLNLAQGQLNTSNAEYLNIVGQNPGDLAPEPELPGVPKTVDQAFDAADQNNAQLLSAIQTEEAARQKVAAAKAAAGPTLSLRVDAAIAPVEPYFAHQYDRDVSVAAVYSAPIFTSGLNSSRIREALEQDNQAQLNVETTRRGVVQLVSRAWGTLTSTRNALVIEAQQVEAEQAAVVGNRIEQRVGTRSTFELMNAEFELTNSQLTLLSGRHDEYLARAQLLAAMGLLEARFLTPGLQTYNPETSLKHVENKVPVPWIGAVESLDKLGAHASAPRMSGSGAGAERPADLPPLPPPPQQNPQPDQ